MKLLLDTHAFLWYSAGDPQLSNRARSLIEDTNNERLLSQASLIEMAIKISLGRLTLSDAFEHFIDEGLAKLDGSILNMAAAHMGRLSRLTFHHRYPFDRMLIAQALVEGIDIISIDKTLDAYGVRRHW